MRNIVLKTLKKMSFSAVLKLAKRKLKKSLLTFAGKWKGKREAKKIFKEILRERELIRLRKAEL